MSWKEHPLAVAAGTAAATTALFFTAVIPTWMKLKDNEIATLKTEPAALMIQLEKLRLEAADSAAARATVSQSAKRIEGLEQRLEAERAAKTTAEQRAADESALRRQIEERGGTKDEPGATRAQKEFEKRINDLEQRLEVERVAKAAAESRAATETKLRQEAEERSRRPQDAGSTSNKERSANASQPSTTGDTRRSPTGESFDLGDIVATAEWARSNNDQLEISFSFTNKTARPLWVIPATRRDKGGIQASDDVKNSYELRSTGGFRRGSLTLQTVSRTLNEYLALQPGVPSPATFVFMRKRGGVGGATQVRVFATLTIVEDMRTLKSYDRTVTAFLGLN